MNQKKVPLHPILTATGILLIPGSVWLTWKLIYEDTILTWERGPQMVGFTLVHQNFAFFLIGVGSLILAHVWLITLAIQWIRSRRQMGIENWIIGGFLLIGLIPNYIPGNVWRLGMIKLYGPGPHGGELLIECAAFGDVKTVQELIKQGVDVNVKGIGDTTPLLAACVDGNAKTVEVLISNGADINTKDITGGTALMGAAENNTPDVIRVLLKHGLDPSLKNNDGKTALDYAVERGRADNAEVLREVMKSRAAPAHGQK